MATYKGLLFPDHVAPLVRHMPSVDDHREALAALSATWDTLALLAHLSNLKADMREVRASFGVLTGELLACLAEERLKLADETLGHQAQIAVDVLTRNLFERTADIGFLAADADNHFLASPTAGAGTLFMNLQTKPFNDPALRQAIAWTVDRQAYVDVAREGASTPIWSVTGLGDLLADEIDAEYEGDVYSVDVDKAKQILTDAGYTWKDDKLIDPDGEAVSFSISVPAGWSDWNTEQALIAEELGEGLGIDVKVDQPDWGGWDAARQEGTFQAIIHWLEDTGNAYGLYTSTMDPKWIVDDKAAFNFGRFDDPAVTAALNTYANASSDADRESAIAVIEKAFVDNVPAIPLGAHPLLGEFNTRNYVGWPSEADAYASADPTQPAIVQILTKLQPAE